MPLTESRTGVFRGRAHNNWQWYAVDPDESDPREVEARWTETFAETNRSPVRRVVAAIAGWATFVGIQAIMIAVVAALSDWSPIWYFAVAVVGLISLVGGATAGLMLAGKIAPHSQKVVSRFRTVMAVPDSVREWASDLTPPSDVWELSVALDRVREVSRAFEYWGVHFDDEWPRPEWAIEAFVGPVLKEQFHVQSQQLTDVAGRLGFSIPEAMLELPTD
jgi:hypothetical protein